MRATLRIPADIYERLIVHLFPGDRDEHGAVILAGLRETETEVTLLARELHLAAEADFPPGRRGYRQISPLFVAQTGGRASDEQLVYLSCHNHPGSGDRVGFSRDDLGAHERLFPHLLDLTQAPVVGGLVFGTDSVAGDIWRRDRERVPLAETRLVGANLRRLYPSPPPLSFELPERFDRQARLFGAVGQARLAELHIGVVGAGGGGSLLVEQLARLGVRRLTVADFDRVEETNLSRIVGATRADARERTQKVEVLRRLVADVDRSIGFRGIDGDISDALVAEAFLDCDFLFLATDTARARLVFNAVTHQFLIPGIQIGAKIETTSDGVVDEIYVAVRPVFPPHGCLDCAGLIDPFRIHQEQLTPEERRAQNYIGAPGVAEITDPSVISLNGIGASHAVTTMLLTAVGLARPESIEHRLLFPADGNSFAVPVVPRDSCLFCSNSEASLLARGGTRALPVRPESRAAGGALVSAPRGVIERIRTAARLRLGL